MVYRFDQFEIDDREFRFSDGHTPVSVEPKALRLLIYLIQNRNRLVPKQELLDKVWPDAIVTENVLTREIVLLRKAFKEDSRSPRYIETVPTVGYRFVAKVTEVGQPAADAAALEKSASTSRQPSRTFVIASLLLLGGVAAVLLSVGLIWWQRKGAPPEDLRPVPLIATGNSCCPTFSPDGTKMAFGWTGEQDAKWEIYVKQIGAPGNPLKLTTSPVGVYWGAIDPVWSPDDRWIAYRRNRADGADLMLVPPLGGPERRLADMSGTAEGPGWTPDGKWVAIPQMDTPLGSSIWAIAIDTGERRRLTTFAARAGEGRYPLGDSRPAFSPNGRSLAFCRKVNDSVYELFVQPLTRDLRPDGEARLVSDRPYAYVDGLVWTPDGRDIVYSAGMFLWRVAASGRQAPRRLGYPAAVLGTAIARTTSRLSYVWWLTNVNIWRQDLRTGERKPLISSAPSLFDRNIRPQYSPDGHKIAFDSFRTGDMEVWTCDADGTNCEQLTNFQGPWGGNPRWSPDSRSLTFDSRASGNSEIYVVAADGGSPRRLTNSPDSKILPSWSHDGRWIYFASDRSGRYEVWKMPRDGGEAIQVTHTGGLMTFESPDGKYLYYTKFNLNGPVPLFRVPADGGEEVLVVPKIESLGLFCVTAKGVYFVPPPPGANTIQFLDAVSGKVSKLTTMDEQAAGANRGIMDGLAVSPDDAYVVWSQMDRNTFNLMLVEGFR
jgi:Tol biopolymer transport system component/DNA-binding winged helix-turn-helix (wHTH) protein